MLHHSFQVTEAQDRNGPSIGKRGIHGVVATYTLTGGAAYVDATMK